MNVSDRRAQFVKKWYSRGQNAHDPFDQFFSLWIALAVAAARWSTLQGNSAYDQTDREKVIQYLTGHEEQVLKVLSGSPQVRSLAGRRGSMHRDPILDTGNDDLRGSFQRFSEHYNSGRRLSDRELVTTLAEILNKVRNNVFHGDKIYDDRDDVAVLEKVNPILRDILQRCEAAVLS